MIHQIIVRPFFALITEVRVALPLHFIFIIVCITFLMCNIPIYPPIAYDEVDNSSGIDTALYVIQEV